MHVFKFGGASVRDAAGVRNLAQITKDYGNGDAVVVVSAMGKTTNALEDVVRLYTTGQTDKAIARWQSMVQYHQTITGGLTGDFTAVNDTFAHGLLQLTAPMAGSYDQVYDQVVSLGEVISTQIIAAYLTTQGIPTHWTDARQLIQTDATYREGRVNWSATEAAIRQCRADWPGQILLTQGFIGRTPDGYTTTLGREGSDYTAAIFAYCLTADSVTIWKDVPGVLNADPKYFDDTVLLEKLTYQDAIELAYYGATVIHPKTIKPLQNKAIPLQVRSFLQPEQAGTVIGPFEKHTAIPSFIFKVDQWLISLHPNDFSFIAEENLSLIFGRFAQAGVKINLMQNTAISFTVAVDNNPDKLPKLLDLLKQDFRVSYNEGLELITIRYYNQQTIERVLPNKKLLLEQKSRNTVQLVVKDLG